MANDELLFQYLLRLGDSPLILAQRLGEWVGKGPAIEEDIALTNVGLDLLGQARLWLSYAGEVEARFRGTGRSEDQLAFTRDGGDFRKSAAGRAAERQLRRHHGAAVPVRHRATCWRCGRSRTRKTGGWRRSPPRAPRKPRTTSSAHATG